MLGKKYGLFFVCFLLLLMLEVCVGFFFNKALNLLFFYVSVFELLQCLSVILGKLEFKSNNMLK